MGGKEQTQYFSDFNVTADCVAVEKRQTGNSETPLPIAQTPAGGEVNEPAQNRTPVVMSGSADLQNSGCSEMGEKQHPQGVLFSYEQTTQATEQDLPSERTIPFFDVTPGEKGGLQDQPLFDSTLLVRPNVRVDLAGKDNTLSVAVTTDVLDGGLKIHDVVTKGRVKMSGIKRKQVDDVEDPVVGKLNKSGVARKICTRRKLSSTPESQHNIGANKAKESGQEQSGQQKQTCKGQRQVDDGSIPPSPFELKFQLPGGIRQIAYDKYRVIMAKTGKQLQRVWLKLEQPKLLEITGAQLQCSFRDDAAIGCAVLSAVVRLLQQEETSMYKKHGSNEKHWRHFMPPEFSDMVLGSEELGITSEVRDMFLGQHMGSMVEYSRMIMVPSRGAGYWSLYMWDMKDRTVHVFDPVCTNNAGWHSLASRFSNAQERVDICRCMQN